MNSPDDDAVPQGDVPAPRPERLFNTDLGSLSLDARLALCKLLTGPCIESDSPLWPALLRDEATIRGRLSDVFLDLILDRDRRIAFTRQADTVDRDTPVLLRSLPLTYMDSVLVLHLREKLMEADTDDRRAVVDLADLTENLLIYAPDSADKVGASKRILASVNKLRRSAILQSVRGSDSRYEISPTLRLLFSPDDIQALSQAYEDLKGTVPDDAPSMDESDA